MSSAEEDFRDYLRSEVEAASERFERARVDFFARTGGAAIEPGPALLDATEDFSEALRLYMGALKRLAHYSAHQARRVLREPLVAHA